MVLALACAAQFMVVLDIAIVNVALPSIQQDLDVGQSTLQWVVIAYGLLLGGFLLLGGRMVICSGDGGCSSPGCRSSLLHRSSPGSPSRRQCSSPPEGSRVRRGAAGTGRALDPGGHVLRGSGAQSCPRDLRRGRWDVGVGGRDRQRPADRRPRLAVGVLHQHPGRHRPVHARSRVPRRRSRYARREELRRRRCDHCDRRALAPRLRLESRGRGRLDRDDDVVAVCGGGAAAGVVRANRGDVRARRSYLPRR